MNKRAISSAFGFIRTCARGQEGERMRRSVKIIMRDGGREKEEKRVIKRKCVGGHERETDRQRGDSDR